MWIEFNTSVSLPTEVKTTVSYLPFIDEKPCDLRTVYTVLKRGSEVAKSCGQDYHVHTFDKQLYADAQDVILNHKEELKNAIVRLGGFHALCTMIACIGKLWGDGGLLAILVDSGVYAHNSAEHMLEGKQFHRSVRALIIVYEALMKIMLKNLYQDLENNKVFRELFDKLKTFNIKYMNQNFNQNEYNHILDNVNKFFTPAFEKFREREKLLSPTFR